MKVTRSFQSIFAVAEPVTRWVSSVEAPLASRFVLERQYVDVKRVLSPGMILLTHRRLNLGNVFLPGFWKHAAIYAPQPGREGSHAIVHATVRDGVTQCDLRDFVLDKDGLAILRPRLDPERLARVVEHARRSIGAPYNLRFGSNDDRSYYCSELVFDCLKVALGSEPFPLRNHWGGAGITPNDLYEERRCFDLVYEFRHVWPGAELSRRQGVMVANAVQTPG
jgi:hypothetical protein